MTMWKKLRPFDVWLLSARLVFLYFYWTAIWISSPSFKREPSVQYWFFSPCFSYPSTLSGRQGVHLKDISWPSCFRYWMFILEVNFSKERKISLFFYSVLLALCPLVAVLWESEYKTPKRQTENYSFAADRWHRLMHSLQIYLIHQKHTKSATEAERRKGEKSFEICWMSSICIIGCLLWQDE